MPDVYSFYVVRCVETDSASCFYMEDMTFLFSYWHRTIKKILHTSFKNLQKLFYQVDLFHSQF